MDFTSSVATKIRFPYHPSAGAAPGESGSAAPAAAGGGRSGGTGSDTDCFNCIINISLGDDHMKDVAGALGRPEDLLPATIPESVTNGLKTHRECKQLIENQEKAAY